MMGKKWLILLILMFGCKTVEPVKPLVQSSSPEIVCDAKVFVKSGFYRGKKGTVISDEGNNSFYIIVESGDRMLLVNGSDLELL